MSEIVLTQAQQAVVENRGGSLLVSAAAGSGKTKVLVDRLMSMICCDVNPANIDDFLIITYTKAAASELRGKIVSALAERLASDPQNMHLQRQMHRVYLAQISTVHAFCGDLLRTYAHVLDLPPDFRVAEEAECEELQRNALQKVLEQMYTDFSAHPDIKAFIDILGYGRDDRRAAEIVLDVYQKIQCHLYPEQWMEECVRAAAPEQYTDAAQTIWGSYLIADLKRFLKEQVAALQQAVELMQEDPKVWEKYGPVYAENIAVMQRLAECTTWDALYEQKPSTFGRLPVMRNYPDMLFLQRIKGYRERCWSELKEKLSFLNAPSKEIMKELGQAASVLRGISEMVQLFSKAYQTEKQRRQLMDFHDLEHYAVKLLLQRHSGQPTQIAEEISARYVEIMVDEYQDSNEVQDQIFSAISRDGTNRFMVGDVKQSIYRFRLADPTIFLKKYQSFQDYQEVHGSEPRKILLSDNFRSNPHVLDAVNSVFRLAMSQAVGGVDYTDRECLHPGLHAEALPQTAVELHCIQNNIGGTEEERAPGKRDVEAQFIAARIFNLLHTQTMISGSDGLRQVQPEDIVILLRSPKADAASYVSALQERGIACTTDNGDSLMDTTEAAVLLAVLQIIDNPHQDVPLIAAMASPIFGFTADELAGYRAEKQTGNFFSVLLHCRNTNQKLDAFINKLQKFRASAQLQYLPVLLDEVYIQLQLEEIFGAMENGEQRVRNLRCLYRLCNTFAAEGQKQLPQLLKYLQRLAERGIPVETGAQASAAVTILSIHKSKGLEFPVVILAGLSKKFNLEDLTEPILLHQTMYAGMNVVDRKQLIQYPSVAKRAISLALQRETISEELRLLYVAMTRAKDMLIMTYTAKYLKNDLERISTELSCATTEYVSRRAKSLGHWVLMAALKRSEAGELFQLLEDPCSAQVSAVPWRICLHTADEIMRMDIVQTHSDEGCASSMAVLPDPSVVKQRLEFVYPYHSSTVIPAKLTATQLKGRSLDTEVQMLGQPMFQSRISVGKPIFCAGEQPLRAAEIGTATHLAMQYIKYENCTSLDGVQRELRRLEEQAFLTTQQCQAIDPEKIRRLFASDLGKKILTCSNVVREFKFSIELEAAQYYQVSAGEKVMLQGVTDCCMIEEDGITVIDFKTDFVTEKVLRTKAMQYSGQLNAYAVALSRIFERPVKRKILYFFAADQAIEI